MNRFPMSKAGAALFRALLARALVNRDRILLTHYRSTDWQSLTFVGERHEMRFRIPGPDAGRVFDLLTGTLPDAEFDIPGSWSPTFSCTENRRTSATAPSASASRR